LVDRENAFYAHMSQIYLIKIDITHFF
jgi:hypothetical protein